MRKLVSILMTVTLMLVSVTACAERIIPSKNYVTRKVNVGSFNAISTSSSVDVIYTQSSGGQHVEIYMLRTIWWIILMYVWRAEYLRSVLNRRGTIFQ